MPTKKAKRQHTTKSKKRYGAHQKRTQTFHKTYLPYLPLVLAIVVSIFLSGFRTSYGVLAYATNTSVGGLLQATNTQRANAGTTSLALNQQLINAAQAKANDMVARNYWSHNTPDGQEPWIFVENAGYSYIKAGENLAYGFLNSNDTITGWMNSTTHRDNMLDTAFSEVGFGFANSEQYNDSGNQTVVVAMYGKPQTLAQTATQPEAQAAPSQPTPTPTASAQQPTQAPPTNNPEPNKLEVKDTAQPTMSSGQPVFTVPASTSIAGLQPVSRQISRVETLTGGTVPWAYSAVAFVLGGAVVVLLLKHSFALRKAFVASEHFVLHHPWIDSTVLAIIIISLTLSSTVGFIQ